MWLAIIGDNVYFQHDGDALLTERSNTGLLRRYVYGPGSDEPILWYEGAGTSDKRYLHADERGSIIAVSNASGAVTQINAYDEFGIPQGKTPSGTLGSTATASFGRFGYTGQVWLPEIGLYNYKARIYSPTLGRFLQSDPIGYGDGMNFYNYVGGDPVNSTDPSGLACMTYEYPGTVGVFGFPFLPYRRTRCTGGGGLRDSTSGIVRYERQIYDGGSAPEEPHKPCQGVVRLGVDGASAVGAGVAAGAGINVDLATGLASSDRYFGGQVGVSAIGGAGATNGTVVNTASVSSRRSIVLGGSLFGFGVVADIGGTLFNPDVQLSYGYQNVPASPKIGFVAAYQAVRRSQTPVKLSAKILKALRDSLCN